MRELNLDAVSWALLGLGAYAAVQGLRDKEVGPVPMAMLAVGAVATVGSVARDRLGSPAHSPDLSPADRAKYESAVARLMKSGEYTQALALAEALGLPISEQLSRQAGTRFAAAQAKRRAADIPAPQVKARPTPARRRGPARRPTRGRTPSPQQVARAQARALEHGMWQAEAWARIEPGSSVTGRTESGWEFTGTATVLTERRGGAPSYWTLEKSGWIPRPGRRVDAAPPTRIEQSQIAPKPKKWTLRAPGSRPPPRKRGSSARLTPAQRKRLPDSDFVFPARRAYPIQDVHQAKVALNTVFRFPATRPAWPQVSRAVFSRYPQLVRWWNNLPSVRDGRRLSYRAATRVAA